MNKIIDKRKDTLCEMTYSEEEDIAVLAEDILYWYGRAERALRLCSEKYNELAELLGWEKV